eukprot:scaffold1886_cov157-Chaetoceros_neogracile.AAC.1
MALTARMAGNTPTIKPHGKRFQSSKILRGAGGSELGSWIDRFILDFAALSSSEELMLFGLAIIAIATDTRSGIDRPVFRWHRPGRHGGMITKGSYLKGAPLLRLQCTVSMITMLYDSV